MSEEEKRKNAKVEIIVDNKATEKLVSILEKEREEKEQKKDEPSLNDLIVQTTKKFGRADLWTQATSKEMLNSMLTSYINEVAEKGNGSPSGSAPANEKQYGIRPEDLFTKKYDSWKSMVDDLNAKRHDSNYPHQKEAQSYWDELEKLWLTGKRLNPKLDDTYNPNLPENLPPLKEVGSQVGSFKVALHKEQGDIGKLVEKWANENPLKRRAKQQIEAGKNPEESE